MTRQSALRRLGPLLGLALPAACLAISGPAPLAGQTDVIVHVWAESTLQPIRAAGVEIGQLGGTADAQGRVVLRAVPRGRHTLVISRIGFQTLRLGLDVGADPIGPLDVVLREDAVALEGIEVAADSESPVLRASGFLERAARGKGTHLSPTELEQFWNDNDLSGPLRRLSGFRLTWNPMAGRFAVESRRGSISPEGPCRPQLFLDGVPMPANDHTVLAGLTPRDVEGIESYAGPASAPARFRPWASCGLLLIWTR